MILREVLISIIILVWCIDLHSQIVNIEGLRMEEDSIGWEGNVDIGFYGSRTTKTLFSLSGGSQIQYQNNDHLFLSLNEIALFIAGDEDFENRGFQHFRYNYKLPKVAAWEVFTQVQFDQVLKIRLRWLTGTGPRFFLLKKERVRLSNGILYMYEYEEEIGTNIINRHHRLSTYLSLNVAINEIFSINNITYYQPRWDQFTDYRISSNTTLKFRIIKKLFFKFGFNLAYDTHPVVDPDIPKLTWNFKNSFSVEF